jgi:hypothetical protein
MALASGSLSPRKNDNREAAGKLFGLEHSYAKAATFRQMRKRVWQTLAISLATIWQDPWMSGTHVLFEFVVSVPLVVLLHFIEGCPWGQS